MASKSHRQKALQSLIDAGPSTSAGQLLPPDSLVVEKDRRTKKSKKSSSIKLGSSLKSSKGKEREDDPEEEAAVEGWQGESGASASQAMEQDDDDDDSEMLIDTAPPRPLPSATLSEAERIIASDTSKPTPVKPLPGTTQSSSSFAPLTGAGLAAGSGPLRAEQRRIPIPPHRMTPLKKEWVNIYGPLVEMMGLMVRMNVQRKCVELKVSIRGVYSKFLEVCNAERSLRLSRQTSKHTPDSGAIQKGADFVKAFALGFDVKDAIAILRLEDLYLDSFEVKDVKTLHGDHLSRAIGRIAGQDGKTKFTIENASRTRIVLADTHIHILGSVQNIRIARDAVVSLILGSPPGKVYAHLRSVGARLKQRF